MIIEKVITSYQDPDQMEEINKLTGLDVFSTDNWNDKYVFEKIEELKKYVTEEELNVLNNGEVDYIAFRLDI